MAGAPSQTYPARYSNNMIELEQKSSVASLLVVHSEDCAIKATEKALEVVIFGEFQKRRESSELLLIWVTGSAETGLSSPLRGKPKRSCSSKRCKKLYELVNAVAELPFPVIGFADGSLSFVGTTLLQAADHVVASQGAQFRFAHADTVFSVDEAQEMGRVHSVVPTSEALKAVYRDHHKNRINVKFGPTREMLMRAREFGRPRKRISVCSCESGQGGPRGGAQQSSASAARAAMVGTTSDMQQDHLVRDTHSIPQETYSMARDTYSMPQVPQDTHSIMRETYSIPLETHSMPQVSQETHSCPRDTYSMPRETYSLPRETYSMPRETYSMPREANSMPQAHNGQRAASTSQAAIPQAASASASREIVVVPRTGSSLETQGEYTTIVIYDFPPEVASREVEAMIHLLGFGDRYSLLYMEDAKSGGRRSFALINFLTGHDAKAFGEAFCQYRRYGSSRMASGEVQFSHVQGIGNIVECWLRSTGIYNNPLQLFL